MPEKEKKKPNRKLGPVPLGYFAGKVKLTKKTIDLFPPAHRIENYVEPFCGGGAIFWNMPDGIKQYVLNDTNETLTQFYRLMKDRDPELMRLIKGSVFSEVNYLKATELYFSPIGHFSLAEQCYAFWYLACVSFANKLGGGYGYGKSPSKTNSFLAKREHIDHFFEVMDRRAVTIFCRDFADLPDIYDSPGSMYYIDPPYRGTHLGHCGTWTDKDDIRLMRWTESKSNSKAWIAISGYLDNEWLVGMAQRNGWFIKSWNQPISATNSRSKKSGKARDRKLEMLITNYDPTQFQGKQQKLIDTKAQKPKPTAE